MGPSHMFKTVVLCINFCIEHMLAVNLSQFLVYITFSDWFQRSIHITVVTVVTHCNTV